MLLKGRMDMRLGHTIIEFKIDLVRELDNALEEIERYTKILRKNGQKIGECIVTDGIRFKVYRVLDEAKEVRSMDFEEVTPEQAVLFLDTFLFTGRQAPTAYDLNMRFGPGSPIYEEVVAELSVLFKRLKDPVKFSLWSKNMQLVYGAAPTDEAFISQTYLMMLVRLLLARYLVKERPSALKSLNGDLFNSQGINLIEEDFFSWILEPLFWPEFKPLVDTITDALDSYDLESIDEDIFKEIYQEIVKRGERHRIGEYYTPEWLAELVLNEAISALDSNQETKVPSILDPACGSGTFLTNAISILRKKGCSLEDILGNVCGMDLNPLAVAISRANYLLALGRLIEKRKGEIFIPVYMADSIKLPIVRTEHTYGMPVLAIDIDKKTQLNLPLEAALEEGKLKRILTAFGDILSEYKRKRLKRDQVLDVLEKSRCCSRKAMPVVKKTLEDMVKLVDDDRDSIWVFMLRNIYAPLRMNQKKFDLVAGNPPWVSLRYVENSDYQDFLKKSVFDYRLLARNETDLFTQLDTSTVFYAKCADIYLVKDGILAFVMPRSVITGAKQHAAFKDQKKPLMRLLKIIDTEKVNPLFNVDSCSLIARKGEATVYPVSSELLRGVLPEKNIRLQNAWKYLTLEKSEYTPFVVGGRKSPYHDEMLNGAGIYPRTLWFVKFAPGKFGLNTEFPSLKSLVLSDAKVPWNQVVIEGEVENGFIFATVTGKVLLPFRTEFQPIVLPIVRGRTA